MSCFHFSERQNLRHISTGKCLLTTFRINWSNYAQHVHYLTRYHRCVISSVSMWSLVMWSLAKKSFKPWRTRKRTPTADRTPRWKFWTAESSSPNLKVCLCDACLVFQTSFSLQLIVKTLFVVAAKKDAKKKGRASSSSSGSSSGSESSSESSSDSEESEKESKKRKKKAKKQKKKQKKDKKKYFITTFFYCLPREQHKVSFLLSCNIFTGQKLKVLKRRNKTSWLHRRCVLKKYRPFPRIDSLWGEVRRS